MDRSLNAFVNLDVPADTVHIDVLGALNQDSRPELVHIIRRVRRMGIQSHIKVELSQAAVVESSALAGLRTDLNGIDASTLPAVMTGGVSLNFSSTAEGWDSPRSAGQPLAISQMPAEPGETPVPCGLAGIPLELSGLEALFGRALEEYSDEELLMASDSLFALLDSPDAFAGSDLLGCYRDIGQELLRRRQNAADPLTALEDQTAS